ncbi:MAG: DUF2721 domain-containing protein [Acidobacteriota bacterium]|nr:DUF2721 domain-containing protein [Acidobacteriota bacterium]
MKQELWLAPLLLLPGVALLIMSTSARYGQLHAEIHRDKISGRALATLFFRAKLFRNALVCLYFSVSAFAVSSLVGGLLTYSGIDGAGTVVFGTCVGVLALVAAAGTLLMESVKALDIIRDHLEGGRDD